MGYAATFDRFGRGAGCFDDLCACRGRAALWLAMAIGLGNRDDLGPVFDRDCATDAQRKGIDENQRRPRRVFCAYDPRYCSHSDVGVSSPFGRVGQFKFCTRRLDPTRNRYGGSWGPFLLTGRGTAGMGGDAGHNCRHRACDPCGAFPIPPPVPLYPHGTLARGLYRGGPCDRCWNRSPHDLGGAFARAWGVYCGRCPCQFRIPP